MLAVINTYKIATKYVFIYLIIFSLQVELLTFCSWVKYFFNMLVEKSTVQVGSWCERIGERR